tara:strand:- start:2883 stop:3674 length:792 start_codon:yes stop_codon:yes gene_type:complete
MHNYSQKKFDLIFFFLCMVEYSMSAQTITPTNDSEIVTIPFAPGKCEEVKQNTEACLNKFCELVAHKFSLEIDEVKQCIPDNIEYKPKQKTKRASGSSVVDWESVTSKSELSAMTASSLKDILSSKQLRTSGSKAALVDRVWGILHPEEAPPDSKPRKRGRPSGAKNKTKSEFSTVVSDSDTEANANEQEDNTAMTSEQTMELLHSGVLKKLSDGEEYYVIESKNWVMKKDNDDDLEWKGYLASDGTIDIKDPPMVLVKLYNS